MAMSLLGCEEGSRLVGLMLATEGIDNPNLKIGQRSYHHAVCFAFLAFALVIGLSPRFLERT